MIKKTYKIKGMSCASCAVKIEKALNRTPGVNKAVVNLFMKEATVTGDAKDKDVKKAVESVGYEVETLEMEHTAHQMPSGEIMEGMSHDEHAEHAKLESATEILTLRNKFIFGTVFSILILVLSYAAFIPLLKNIPGQTLNYLIFILTTPIMIWLGSQFYRGTWYT